VSVRTHPLITAGVAAPDRVPPPPDTTLETDMHLVPEQMARSHLDARQAEAAESRLRRVALAARRAQAAERKAEQAERRARLAREAAVLAAREAHLSVAH
jgi:hypothetical protein